MKLFVLIALVFISCLLPSDAGVLDFSWIGNNEISQGRMNHREFVAKLKETAPGFELGGELAGELRRAETSLKGNWEGAKGLSESQSVAGGIKGRLRSLGEKVRSGLEGFGLFRRKESGSNSQHRGLQERIAKGPAAEQATRAAEQATRAAVQYLDGKISEVGKTIQQLEGKRPLLQGEIQLAREGAERYRGRSESLGKLAGRYDQLLNGLEDRIVLRSSDSQTQEVVRPALDLTPQWKDGEVSKKGLLREWMRKGDDGLNPGYAPHPFNRAGPEPGGLLKEWQSRGVKPPQRLYAAHDSIEMARGYLPTAEHPSGINPNRINPNSRDAQARYLSPDPAVTVDELAAHGKVGRWMVEYEVQWENVRGIDQRTPQGAAKIGAAVDGNNYVDTSAPAHRGRMGGANALVRDSVRHEGGMVVSVLGDFDQVLKPTGRIIKMPADLVAIGESKVKASAGISNVSEAGPPAPPITRTSMNDGLGFKDGRPIKPSEVEITPKRQTNSRGAVPQAQNLILETPNSLTHRPSWKSERVIAPTPGKTTTVIGNYKLDMKRILHETNYPQGTDFGRKEGGFNLLNVSKESYNPATFWERYNEPWLKQATSRGDDVVVVSNPQDRSLLVLVQDGRQTGFSKELDFMENQVKLGRYRHIAEEGKYVSTR
jgi:hypothetical protein